MGGKVTRLLKNPKKVKVLLLGPDAAGKTTLLYRLKTGRHISTIPTIGFNVEEVKLKRGHIVLWDLGGQDKIRAMWKHYFTEVGALAFVVDSSDRERLQEAKNLLQSILKNQEMSGCVVIVLANKQDVKGAMSIDEIANGLGLGKDFRHKWHVQPCCAITGDGVCEGFDWVLQASKKKKKADDAIASWITKSNSKFN